MHSNLPSISAGEIQEGSGIDYPNAFRFQAAQGWLELGLPLEAAKEIQEMDAHWRWNADVLEIIWSIHAALEEWQASLEVTNLLVAIAPDRLFGWVHHSYALHKLNRTAEAAERLISILTKFPQEWIVRYNLACCLCDLQKPAEAWKYLDEAFRLCCDPELKQTATREPDLATLNAIIEASLH